MKKVTLITTFLICVLIVKAQLVNLNPNPNGEPWITGGVPEVTPDLQVIIDQIPNMVQQSFAQRDPVVDNSQQKYMRPIFNQGENGSCSQASGIGYVFTYEINWYRDLSADNETYTDNLYPPGYTYNFLNGGSNSNGTSIWDGWRILSEMGCPNITTYGNMYISATHWMTGYNAYSHSMENRAFTSNKINFLTNPSQALETLKQWIFDHDTGEDIGGIASFRSYMQALTYGTYINGETLITSWGSGTGDSHMLTAVGYDDNLYYDLNNNSIAESDEYGAFKVYNSWGTDEWPEVGNSAGYVYFPYKIFMDKVSNAYILDLEEECQSELALRVKMTHPKRNDLRVRIQKGENANSVSAPWWSSVNYESYFAFEQNVGSYPLLGSGNSNPLEIELDFSYFYPNEDYGKLFLNLHDMGVYAYGSLVELDLIDRRWGETFILETEYDNEQLLIDDNEFYVNYDLIPHESPIITNLTLSSDMVSRFNPTVSFNSTLIVASYVNVDMYDSEINISEGSTLQINNYGIITAKRGNCKIIIDGDITIGDNVSFIAEDGATLEIILKNKSLETTLNETNFVNSELKNYGRELTITNSEFTDCPKASSYLGDVIIDNTDFTNTWLYLANQMEEEDFTATVTKCDFYTDETMMGIELWNYQNYLIEQNTIDGYYNGIQLMQTGEGAYGNQKVLKNDVMNCTQAGILVFNSTASIENNYIHDNNVGVRLYNNSNIDLIGDPMASTNSETQRIEDNDSYEVHASPASFPWYMRFNVIFDSDNGGNPNDPIIYYSGSNINDIRYNCWDNSFVPAYDLYPVGAFVYDPKRCPSKSPTQQGDAELLYLTGIAQYDSTNFAGAKSTFERVINQYPETEYASAAMKDLFTVEQYLTNDYTTLQLYFTSDSVIQADTVLTKLSVFLSNKCEIEMEHWQTAIDHFEDIILDPDSPEDSIFAIIDLGHVYFLMNADSTSKDKATGRLWEHIPTSEEAFFKKRDYLLSLLPIQKNVTSIEENIYTEQGVISDLQLFPNPTKDMISISFELESAMELSFVVYDQYGKKHKVIPNKRFNEGSNAISMNLTGLASGVYFLSVKEGDKTITNKKLVVM